MKKKLKGIYLLISTLFIGLLHLPFAFGKLASNNRFTASASKVVDSTDKNVVLSVYDSLQLNKLGLDRKAFDFAKKGWDKLVAQGKLVNSSVLAIADFSQPSSQKRLYILDLKNYKLLYQSLVAHGRNSGKEMAVSFSNRMSSNMSSPGFYITGDTYNGNHGLSLKLNGVEKGINDNAYQRAIVVHGANYVNEGLASKQGYIGRSLGCPAIPMNVVRPIINTIRNNTCFFIYEPGQAYSQRSALLS